MKLKKMLASILCIAMVLSTMGITVFANENAVARIGDTEYTSLSEALSLAGAAGAGDTTIEIIADIDLEDVTWTPVKVDGYHGADIVTINGNNKVIKNLSAPLFAGGFAGGSGIVINGLTIAESNIVSTNTLGSGAFVECVDSMDTITLNNCHLLNSSVKGSRTGGLIGWTSGYNNQNDGPVKTYVTITDCSVKDCKITGTSSVGAINGHAGANAWTYTTIENCTIESNTLTSTDSGGWRVGIVVGTANVGQVSINNIEESGNKMSQGDKNPTEGQTTLVGRFVPSNDGKLVIDDVPYTDKCKPFAVKIGDAYYATFEDADGAAALESFSGSADETTPWCAYKFMVEVKEGLTKINVTATKGEISKSDEKELGANLQGSVAFGVTAVGVESLDSITVNVQ